MHIEKEFITDSRPVVPASIRNNLNQLLKSTTRIVIDEVVAKGKTRKVNAIKLTNKPDQYPKEPLEEICETIVAIMHDAWAEQETEDPEVGPPPMEFCVTCEHKADNRRQRNQFSYTYMGEREADYVEETMTLEERAIQRTFELLERMNNSQAATIGEYQNRFLRIVEQNTGQAAAGSAMMQQAIPMFLAGVQGQLNAKAMEFDASKHEAKERASTARIEAVMAALAPFVGSGIQQFLRHKMGMTGPPDAPTEASPAAEVDGEEKLTHPSTAELVRYFGGTLTVQQRRKLNAMLTKRQQKAFDDLFCAETDEAARAGYADVLDHALDKLGALQQLLTEEQGELLTTFIGMVSRTE